MSYWMGIDIGTYESKGVLIDEQGRLVASASRAHPMHTPQPGWAEHDAEETWWGDFCALSQTLLKDAGVPGELVAAVGLSAIAPCCLPVDAQWRPLRRGILYGIDVRAAEEIEQLNAQLGEAAILERCGTPLTSQSAAAKILWLRNHEPEVYRKAAYFLTASSYLTAKLTGRAAIDRYTAAAWVPLYDPESQDWLPTQTIDICRREQLADCLWTNEIAGTVHAEAACATGLALGTPVLCGTADAAAEAVSVGVLSPGDLMLMYGSSVFMIHVTDRMIRDPRIWSGPYLFPGTWAVTAGMSCAGTLTRWFRDTLAPDVVQTAEQAGDNPYASLARLAAPIPPGSDGLIVLPYFSGERTPINDPLARGMFFGLHLNHSRAHLYNACLEGVGYGIGQHIDIYQERGMETTRVCAVGGGTRNDKWLQVVSDITGLAQTVPDARGGAAFGDALLAAMATGRFSSCAEMAQCVQMERSICPDHARHASYQPYRKLYGQLYAANRDLMHQVAQLD